MTAAYDRYPVVEVPAHDCTTGWSAIADRLIAGAPNALCVECYPGALVREIEASLAAAFMPDDIIRAEDFYRPAAEIERMLAPHLTDDPVFGRMNPVRIEDLFDPAKLDEVRARAARSRRVLAIGSGASLITPAPDVLVYADLARREILDRYRSATMSNLGIDNASARFSIKYKHGFFVDWRAADRLKRRLFSSIQYVLDTHVAGAPKLISGEAFRAGLRVAVSRPFRVVPFFDPGPWGGQWMKRTFGLPDGPPNYAWCFDCVPEENSLLLGFGGTNVEVPSIDLVFFHPRELLGDAVHARFGTEFPIRFDFLDTMEGGNLSLQVHPLTEYIQEQFGMHYTQDESYYVLDAAADACVFLGLKEGIVPAEMLGALERAQAGSEPFPAEQYVNRWPAKKHDHFLIPGGTVHASGRNAVVLEISATPYIFTFKLWDWDRLDLDGRPRPIHLDHGRENIQWHRTTEWVRRELVNRIEPIASGPGWREERTGLHERQFIETRRHWFDAVVEHTTGGGVNVLNLVEGREAVVESPTGAFAPFTVHYAETFIVPAVVGAYTIRPGGPYECATIKAFVRTGP